MNWIYNLITQNTTRSYSKAFSYFQAAVLGDQFQRRQQQPQPAAQSRDYSYHAGSAENGRPVYYVVEEPDSLHSDRSPYSYEPADTHTSISDQVENSLYAFCLLSNLNRCLLAYSIPCIWGGSFRSILAYHVVRSRVFRPFPVERSQFFSTLELGRCPPWK